MSDEEVVNACTEAKAWDFIEEKPDKLMTHLTGGSNLSGGQKQRLAIARAIIRQPDVILLDEATSALDNENEAKVQKALDALARKGSALVIAHRLSTIRDSDKIVVVDKCVAVEIGTHDDLLEGISTMPAEDAAPIMPHRARTTTSTSSSPTVPLLKKVPSLHIKSSSDLLGSAGSGGDGVTTYKRLWDAATGASDKLSLASMTAKIEKMESELSTLKSKHNEWHTPNGPSCKATIRASRLGAASCARWLSHSSSSIHSPMHPGR